MTLLYYVRVLWQLSFELRKRSLLGKESLKGHCHGDFTFWGENVLKFELNAFSRTPRTSRKGNQMIFQRENNP